MFTGTVSADVAALVENELKLKTELVRLGQYHKTLKNFVILIKCT